ncbi:hypothetical protein [Pseudofrankia sp. BMG5.36]|uniref:hypothetical protein n=1 Tax=Pseudofrankia sp. BMG5.36 TaxID=1834512 RepID=UPI00104202D1|nr:hypothetical protein [Pseudofrankia sp. BMG5.36]
MVTVITILFAALFITSGHVVARADALPTPWCSEEQEGDTQEHIATGEWWICEYDPAFGWIWKPAQWLFDEEDTEDDFSIQQGSNIYLNRTLSRVEDLWDGLHTGADVFSALNGTRWSVPAGWLQNQMIIQKWNGSSWVNCNSSPWYSNNSATDAFTPTVYWGSACGENGWYSSWGAGYQWTGSAWNGGSVWSGLIYLDCKSCRSQQQPEPPTTTPPTPKFDVPRGTPDDLKGKQRRIPASSSVTIHI